MSRIDVNKSHPVRGHQASGVGPDLRGGKALRAVLRQSPLAGRHADQLAHRFGFDRASARTGNPAGRRRRRRAPEEGRAEADARARQARAEPGRHQEHGRHSRHHVRDRHEQGSDRHPRGPQAEHPGHCDPGHQLRPRRHHLSDPGQR